MGNTASKQKNRRTKPNTKSTSITKVTLEGILLNEDKIKNTKTIQLLDANGRISSEIITVSNKSITSCIKQTRAIPIPKSELILSYWFRTLMDNEEEYTLVDKQLLSLILKYARYEISIRLTRPLSIGVAQDMHHLHIRQIQVYSRDNGICPLKYVSASPCMARGSPHEGGDRTPKRCIDGDTNQGTYNHNDYSNRPESNSEDHWMEFMIDTEKCEFIDDIDHVMIYNRVTNGYCMRRLQGSVLQLLMDGKVVKNWTVNGTQKKYEFKM